jgi:hypothetical protein
MQLNKLNFGIAVASLIVAVGTVAIGRADNRRPTDANINYANRNAV